MQIYLPYRRSAFPNLYSLQFDGVDEFLEIADANSLSFGDGAGNDSPFSISSWVYWSSGVYSIFSKAETPNAFEYGFALNGSGILFGVLYNYANSNVYIGRLKSVGLTANIWHHLAMTYSGSKASSGVILYANAVQVDDANFQNGVYTGMTNTIRSVTIGKWRVGGTSYGAGYSDEISLWNKELSLAEVQEIYNLGKPSNLNNHSASANIVTWLRNGDGDTYPNIIDQIGANDGIMNNMEAGDIQTNVP